MKSILLSLALFLAIGSNLFSSDVFSKSERLENEHVDIFDLISGANVKCIKLWLGHLPPGLEASNLNVQNNFNGLNPLQYALIQKPLNREIVRILLENGADPNLGISELVDKGVFGVGPFYAGWTAMHIAVRAEVSQNILQLLDKYKGRLFKPDYDGYRPIDIIFHDRNLSQIKYLKKNHLIEEVEFLRKKNDAFYRNIVQHNFPKNTQLVFLPATDTKPKRFKIILPKKKKCKVFVPLNNAQLKNQ